jgi:hypothetical protein
MKQIAQVLFRFAAIVTGILFWFIDVVFCSVGPFILKYFPSKLTLVVCLFHNVSRI